MNAKFYKIQILRFHVLINYLTTEKAEAKEKAEATEKAEAKEKGEAMEKTFKSAAQP